MIKNISIFSLLTLTIALVMSSCDPFAEDVTDNPGLKLTYSVDTLKFDTVVTSVTSINRAFRVFNPHDQAIVIDRLYLGLTTTSEYDLIVQGHEGKSFENITVFGGDSLLVIAEVLINPMDEDLPYLVKDSVILEYNTNQDHVKLVSWGQDAHFLERGVIECDAVWDSPKPYVIMDTVLVDSTCTLTVQEGVRIYMDHAATILVNGTLNINGTAENKVVIRTSRIDAGYDRAPGQWGTLFFGAGSRGNTIDHAEIRNGITGLILGVNVLGDNAELTLTNTSIGHMSSMGIFALHPDLLATNLEIFDCGSYLMANVAGGNYSFNHCTFTNSPNQFWQVDDPAVAFSNEYDNERGTVILGDLNVELTNSIIWGETQEGEELLLAVSDETSYDLTIENNIIRSSDSVFTELGNYISQWDTFPGFYAPRMYDFRLDSTSNARDKAPESDLEFDLNDILRDSIPDIGAHERKDSIP